MLIIDEDQFLKELAKSSSTPPSLIKREIELDKVTMENHTFDNFRKPNGIPNIPNEVKPIIAALAILDSASNAAEAFGVSKDNVGNLANDNHKNGEVTERKINILESVKTKSVAKIEECLDFLTIAKEMPRKELLATAESLSRIHKNVTPHAEAPANVAQFIYYIPESQAKVTDYEVVDAQT